MVLVGCGAVSRYFYTPAIKTLSEHGDINLKALVDPVKANSDILTNEFPHAERAVDIKDVDISNGQLVIIASPPRFSCFSGHISLGKRSISAL